MQSKNNPGKREREAGKRHRRARFWNAGADQSPLKLGRKKMRIRFRKAFQGRTFDHHSVADSEYNA